MLGAIIGDIVGSTREWHNIKTEKFKLLPKGSHFTDDTVMTLAVAQWLMTDSEHRPETLIACMQRLGRKYPKAGYGGMFSKWLMAENPQPYGSFGNGSAMRVSPVGLYAQSLEEALELARITSSVSHNHPEGIKGAQAIAACVYLKKKHGYINGERVDMKEYVSRTFGYNLDIDLKELRKTYKFDVTCQGSVPVAIKAFLDRENTYASSENALRLAISMGGDSDTIGAMTASVAAAQSVGENSSGGFDKELIEGCRALLTEELLDINDRFEAFITRPLYQSYRVDFNLYAGEYPGDKDPKRAAAKLKEMHHFGVRHFIDLTEEGELRSYSHLLPADTTYERFPIKDMNAPTSVDAVNSLIDRIDYMAQQNNGSVYIHCWGGVGRTGTIVACWKARYVRKPSITDALYEMRQAFSQMPKSSYRNAPETRQQLEFIEKFMNAQEERRKNIKARTRDRIRGSLMAGAAGDALGYIVEFMPYMQILAKYGSKGITQFDLSREGKALVSDDTQMTLFTANGMLMGITRGCTRGIGGCPEQYVQYAYTDWYYTQTNKEKPEYAHTWLRDLPELAHRRAPGITCLNACESLLQNEEVRNNSKGCGGIMRVAPMPLLMAGYWSRGIMPYDIPRMNEAGGVVAEVTHKHPLGFLPAALMTDFIFRLMTMDKVYIEQNIAQIALDSIGSLNNIHKGKYADDKRYLVSLTRKAVELAMNGKSDNENIRQLGEGWVAEEAWAIALYCTVRHIDDIEAAIIAAVNHDGDSDSTGSICGNIIGAIYGYEAIKRLNIFCPQGRDLEQTLELSNIILAIADDLYTSCIIGEYYPETTPEERQWEARYCDMRPAGIERNNKN